MTLREIADKLKTIESAAIFCHMRPDGDTLGAALGLQGLLRACGIPSEVVCESPVPAKFFFLEGMREVASVPTKDAQAFIAVDSSDEARLGALCETFTKSKKIKFNIDHHVSNTRFGDYCYVEERAATCEIVTALADELEVPIDAHTANCLLLGVSSDSGNFAHKNVTENTFLTAAKLLRCGADIHEIQYNMFKRQPRERALLFGRTMSKIRYFYGDKIALISVGKKTLEECGATSDMTEGFIDFPLSVDGVEVAACLLETKPHSFKISLRSKGRSDVNKIASVYGGGGHVLASGCMIGGELEEVVDKLVYTIRQHIED